MPEKAAVRQGRGRTKRDSNVLRAHLAGAPLADHQADGGVLQAEALADLVDEIPLVAEMEQRFGVDKGHERGRAGGRMGQVEDLLESDDVRWGLDCGYSGGRGCTR